MSKTYKIEEDLKPYLHPLQPWGQQAVLPNLEEITDPTEALKHISWSHANIDYYNAAVMLPGKQYPTYCKLFTNPTPMGGTKSWDGSGLIMTKDWPTPRVFKFALCQHKKRASPDARPDRGWHPGICEKCGMDMTVDSGD